MIYQLSHCFRNIRLQRRYSLYKCILFTSGDVNVDPGPAKFMIKIRKDRSMKEGTVACYIKKLSSYSRKSNFCPNIESIFIDIYPKQNQFR